LYALFQRRRCGSRLARTVGSGSNVSSAPTCRHPLHAL